MSFFKHFLLLIRYRYRFIHPCIYAWRNSLDYIMSFFTKVFPSVRSVFLSIPNFEFCLYYNFGHYSYILNFYVKQGKCTIYISNILVLHKCLWTIKCPEKIFLLSKIFFGSAMMSNTIMDIEGEDSKPQQGEIQSQEYVVCFFCPLFL